MTDHVHLQLAHARVFLSAGFLSGLLDREGA
jgi:hypothetical protein